MRKNRRIVLGIKEEEMLLALACVFLKHGAEPEELELISDPAFLENKQDIDWLIADESCAEGIWPVTGEAFVIGDRTEKNPDIMYLRKGLTAEELYQEMVTKLTVRGMSEDDMQDESWSFDFEMDDIPEENIGSRLYLSYSPVGGCGKTLGTLALCRHFALQGKRVLYLNLEPNQDFAFFLKNREAASADFADAVCSQKADLDDLQSAVGEEGFFYIRPLEHHRIQNQDFLKTFTEYIQKLLEQEEYEIIMAEIPYRLDQNAKILADLADKVLVFGNQNEEAAFKLRLAKKSEITDPEKYLYICNRFREEDKNNLEDMDITEYVPEVENPSVESLTENDCFFLTAEILR